MVEATRGRKWQLRISYEILIVGRYFDQFEHMINREASLNNSDGRTNPWIFGRWWRKDFNDVGRSVTWNDDRKTATTTGSTSFFLASSSSTHGSSWQVPGRISPTDSLSTQLYNPLSNWLDPVDHPNEKQEQLSADSSSRRPATSVYVVSPFMPDVSVPSCRVTQLDGVAQKWLNPQPRVTAFLSGLSLKCGIFHAAETCTALIRLFVC